MQENSPFQTENSPVSQISTPKERAVSFMLSVGLLVIVLIFSAAMHALTFMKDSELSDIQSRISSINSQIKKLESEKGNKVASLLADNSIPSIRLMPLLVQFRAAASKAQVQFQGFSIQDDSIVTNLIAVNTSDDAVKKILEMMKNFAKNGQQGTFALEPILSIRGDRNTRTTPITFKIVPIKAEESQENSQEKPSQETASQQDSQKEETPSSTNTEATPVTAQ